MRKSLWKQLVLLSLLLAVVSGSVAWAAPSIPSQPIRAESPGIASLWWSMLTDWLGWSSSAPDERFEHSTQATTVGEQAPVPDPTLWECNPCADAGPDLDPDG